MTEFEKTTSTPRLTEFDPRKVPFQIDVIKHVRKVHLYNQGPCELMLSGSVGSAKTILAAHLVATHVLHNSGAQVVVMRRTLKDLKATFWRVLLTHFPEMNSWLNKSEMRITLPNGSIIYGLSYDDGRFDKFRSI
jgi:RecG-like helicase